MIYLGIDPGKNGALAVLNAETMAVEITDMPDTTVSLHNLVAALPVISFCTIEKPIYPRMIGTPNVAKIAQAYGILTGALAWRDVPFEEVLPAKWKAAMGLSSSKSASREMASQIFPDQSHLFARVKDDGRAEAALLAVFCSQRRRRTQ